MYSIHRLEQTQLCANRASILVKEGKVNNQNPNRGKEKIANSMCYKKEKQSLECFEQLD